MAERQDHYGHGNGHDYSHRHGKHGHTHGTIDPPITTSGRGIWAIKWSFIGLAVTALLQIVVVLLSHSVGLLADAIHNFGDAATAIPLWSAFMLSRWKPNEKFTYGYGRVEDLAGMAIVLTIFVSAVAAGYETVQRFSRSQPVGYLWAVMAASVIGFIGNEAVAILRIRVGREIESAALIADGYHARIDGWTSLAVFFGEVGVWMGYALADPIVGALITIAIAQIVWQSAKVVFTRALDGVDPKIIDELRHAATHVRGVEKVTDVRARWLGHRLYAEINVAVAPQLPVEEGHALAKEVRHEAMHRRSPLECCYPHRSDAGGRRRISSHSRAHPRRPAGAFALAPWAVRES